MEVQFVSNAAGEPTAVLVPIKEWERLQKLAGVKKPAAKPSRKEQFKADFREAVREMQLTLEGKLPKKSAQEFLRELRDE